MKEIKERLVSLTILVVVESIAGLTLLHGSSYLKELPLLFILIPALMDLRGDVMGPYGFRLMNALHLGTAKPSFSDRFNILNTVLAMTVMLFSSILVFFSVIAIANGLGIRSRETIELLFLSLITSFLSAAAVIPLIVALTNYLYRIGANVENFLPAIITGSMDLITPITLFSIINLINVLSKWILIMTSTGLIILMISGYLYLMRSGDRELIKSFKENLVTAVVVATGSGLGGIVFALNPDLAISTGIVALLPALNSLIGSALGVIAGNISITLHLRGRILFSQFINSLKSLIIALVPPVIFLIVLTTSTSHFIVSLNRITPHAAFVAFITPSLLTVVLSFIAYYLSKLTFSKGMNPDNIVFPALTTLADISTPLTVSLMLYSIILLL
jgi:mgtE-like transporter